MKEKTYGSYGEEESESCSTSEHVLREGGHDAARTCTLSIAPHFNAEIESHANGAGEAFVPFATPAV